jgi:hypothetical protein
MSCLRRHRAGARGTYRLSILVQPGDDLAYKAATVARSRTASAAFSSEPRATPFVLIANKRHEPEAPLRYEGMVMGVDGQP